MTAAALSGRRVLILHPAFFGVDDALASALRSLGAEVKSWSTRPSNSASAKAMLRVAPGIWERGIARTLHRRISEIGVGSFDTVVVIKGEGVSVVVLESLRRKLPNAVFNAYLFDSVRNFPRVLEKVRCFDRVLSFDPADCDERPNWIYRPLYAADCYWHVDSRGAESIYSLGSFHPERARVLSRFVAMERAAGIGSAHDMLLRGWIDRMRSMHARVDPHVRILRAPISAEEAARRFGEHSTILDIHHPGQTGLTLRTFEALASGRKLITTNPAVRDHEFFDPARILVIGRAAPKVDPNFLRPPPDASPLARLPERYGVRGWSMDLVTR
ncbi:MAG: hypothetical protein NT176_20175 [Proteobacteria bacterium]|nr:hypothetical protein [Pseudomonadota bacterium]